MATSFSPGMTEEHEYTDYCDKNHSCDECRYVVRRHYHQPCNLCIYTDTCYWEETGTNAASQEAYFLDIWRSCGEASLRGCNSCPVPTELCEKWNEGCD
jgi:hypothetical protein